MPTQELFQRGVDLFNRRQYFAAHETWEDLWRLTDGPLRKFYQGLIQAAVGLHHLDHGNLAGARAQLTKSLGHLQSFPPDCGGIDDTRLIAELTEILAVMEPRDVQIARLQ